MKALTVRQPYADAIIHGGHPFHGRKTVENRSRPIPPKYVGATILIHAGAAPHRDSDIWGPRPDVRSAILGTAVLASSHLDSGCCTPWGMTDYFHWQLEDVRALAEPVPASGQLGLWTPTPNVLAAVQDQLEQEAAR